MDRLLELLNNKNISRMLSTVPHPFLRQDAETYLKRFMPADLDRLTGWAILWEGSVIGGCALVVIGERPEIVFWLGQAYWRRGFMSEALTAVIAYAFEQRGLQELVAEVYTDNPASIHLLLKFGFSMTGEGADKSAGRDGHSYPFYVFSLHAEEFIDCAPPPKKVSFNDFSRVAYSAAASEAAS